MSASYSAGPVVPEYPYQRQQQDSGSADTRTSSEPPAKLPEATLKDLERVLMPRKNR